jgi:pre-mRNA-splicing factor 18
MDFAALMQGEISKGKSNTSSNTNTKGTKYVRRGDAEATREAAYLAEQRQRQAEKQDRASKKRKLEEEEEVKKNEREEMRRRIAEESKRRKAEEDLEQERSRRRRLGLPDLPDKPLQTEEIPKEEDIPEEELTEKLRKINEPKLLFGESHAARLRRYKNVESRIELARKSKDQPIPTSLDLVPEAEMKVPKVAPTEPDDLVFLYRQLASYFTLVLREWKIALNQRPDSVKESYSGKAAATALEQCILNMRPLFRHFETGKLEKGILQPVIDIVRAAQERRYVDASDSYLKLSIGNA